MNQLLLVRNFRARLASLLRSPPSVHLLDTGRQKIYYLKRLLTKGRVSVRGMGKKQKRPEILLAHKEGRRGSLR